MPILISQTRRPTQAASATIVSFVSTFVLLAAATAAEPQYPLALVADSDGVLFVVDKDLPGVWRLEGGALTVAHQASKTFRTPLNAPRCIALDREGKLLVGDSATRDVYRLGDGTEPQALTKGGIGIPMGIAVNAAGDLYVSDLELHAIWKVPAAGGEPARFADVPAPKGVAIDGEGRIWVVSHGVDQLLRLASDGKVEVVVKGRPFQFPHQVALDEGGNAYVTDGYAKAVWMVPTGGEPQKLVEGEPLVNPVGLAINGGKLWIADPKANAIFELDPATKELKRVEWK